MKKLPVLLFDGAYGTYYKGPVIPFEMANLKDSQAVLQMHLEYIRAGATAIKTNTYGANTYRLACDLDALRRVIEKACDIARSAAGDQVRVFADIGPVTDENGEADLEQTKAICSWFLKQGVTDFLFETNADDAPLLEVLPWLKKKAQVFTIACFAVDPQGYTKKGLYYLDIMARMRGASDAYGLNCMSGPSHLLRLIGEVDFGTDAVCVLPNAGYPANIDGRMVYNDNPAYFAQKTAQMANIGVQILGGCCGTTPQHIESLAKALKGEILSTEKADRSPDTQKQGLTVQNRFREQLEKGEKVIACELHSPSDPAEDNAPEKVLLLKHAGADLITIADSPLARARADSFLYSAKLKREAGIDVMPHLTCRDRNYIGVRGALLGGYLETLRNVLIITGDPVSHGGEEKNKGVYNANSFEMIRYIESLNENIFHHQSYFIGCGANPNVSNFESELLRCMKKQQSGARFCLTQPVYSQKSIENVLRIKRETELLVLAGIMPVASYKNALFLNNEVPGIEIPDTIVEAYRDKTKEGAQAVSVEVCLSIMRQLYAHVDGFYMICPLNQTDVVARLIGLLKEGLA